ncbi:MAG: exodeoxyribonuclease V subunit gamma [Xanthomonadales bacterium]|nr:exodeoxyribonuclease V subunit gamma [Xanthomonadales bacterium]
MPHTDSATGLRIYRASRLEALLMPLRELMRAAPPQHALAPHELIAAHPGMRRWLLRELARKEGPGGIVANIRVDLSSTWLDRLASEVLGADSVASEPYRREFLRWRIHELLDGIGDARVSQYLAGEPATRARRRFQLAERLARIYTQYLVYRPDWLDAWAAGRRTDPEGGFLADIWQALRAGIGKPHRGERVRALVAALQRRRGRGAALPSEPLHVFGIAHLAPAELAILREVAASRLVVLYVPDPCREYWGGITGNRAQLREQVRQDPAGAAAESLFLEDGHPLLGAWGRMGQHFVLALDEIGAHADDRDREDASDADPATRLAAVQESIRRGDPDLIGERAPLPREDASLRVHACHTRLRELEVLRDALLDARAADPTLKPSEIVVMMPDIHAYLPLLPVVFGAAGRHQGPLPYHTADVAASRAHPLFEAFRALLELPAARLTAPEVADLLAIPPVAARLGLGEDGVDIIKRWLADSRVAWALDGTARRRFEVPGIDAQTLAWGMDRLVAGYLVGAGEGDGMDLLELPDKARVAPVSGVHGPQAALLGSFDTLLLELAEAADDAVGSRPASEWAERFERRIDTLFRIEPGDREGHEALTSLRGFVRALASEPAAADLDPSLDFSVVREILLGRLDGVPEHQRFLLGGVTFCGMVPQRAIPFRMVAVLGLDDGEFPRGGSDGGLDLMARHARLGDRNVRSDDRYLFLETVMAARDRLHLSYIGQGVKDGKPRNPAAPLAELMAALDAASREPEPAASTDAAGWLRRRPWWVRHALQPFDGRYFDGADAALFSFGGEFSGLHPGQGTGMRRFIEVPGRAERLPATPAGPIALAQVQGYFSDPARQLLASGLHLRLDALGEERLLESEALDAGCEALDTVARRVFLRAVARHPHALPDGPPDWLLASAMLPPGRPGEQAWQEERGKVEDLLAAIGHPGHAAHRLFADALPEGRPAAIDMEVDGIALSGEIRDVFDAGGTRWLLRVRPGKKEGELHFKDRIGLFLDWALLRLATDAGIAVRPALVVPVRDKGKEDAWSAAFCDWDARFCKATGRDRLDLRGDLERRVAGLVRFFLAAEEAPTWYFPRTSWAALQGNDDKTRAAWCGNDKAGGERDYAPGYGALLAGERDFGDAEDFELLLANAAHLDALIRVDSPLEETA